MLSISGKESIRYNVECSKDFSDFTLQVEEYVDSANSRIRRDNADLNSHHRTTLSIFNPILSMFQSLLTFNNNGSNTASGSLGNGDDESLHAMLLYNNPSGQPPFSETTTTFEQRYRANLAEHFPVNFELLQKESFVERFYGTDIFPHQIEGLPTFHCNIPVPPKARGVWQFEVTVSHSPIMVGWVAFHNPDNVGGTGETPQTLTYVSILFEKTKSMYVQSGDVVTCVLDIEQRRMTTFTKGHYFSEQTFTPSMLKTPPGHSIFFIPVLSFQHGKCSPNYGTFPHVNQYKDASPLITYPILSFTRTYYQNVILAKLLKLIDLSPTFFNESKFILLATPILTDLIDSLNVYTISTFFYPVLENLILNYKQSTIDLFLNLIETFNIDQSIYNRFISVLFSRITYLLKTQVDLKRNINVLKVVERLMTSPITQQSIFSNRLSNEILQCILNQRQVCFFEYLTLKKKNDKKTSKQLQSNYILLKNQSRQIQYRIVKLLLSSKDTIIEKHGKSVNQLTLEWFERIVSNHFSHSKKIASGSISEQLNFSTLSNLYYIVLMCIEPLLVSAQSNVQQFPESFFYLNNCDRQRVGGVYSFLKKNFVIDQYDQQNNGLEPIMSTDQQLYNIATSLLQISLCTQFSLIKNYLTLFYLESNAIDAITDLAHLTKKREEVEQYKHKIHFFKNEVLELSVYPQLVWRHVSFTASLFIKVLDSHVFEFMYDYYLSTIFCEFCHLIDWDEKEAFTNYNLETTNQVLTILFRKHDQIVDRETKQQSIDLIWVLLRRPNFYSILTNHPDFEYFVQGLLMRLSDTDLTILTVLTSKQFKNFSKIFQKLCIENPNSLLKLLNSMFSNISENIESKVEVKIRLQVFEYLCTNFSELILGNQTSMLIIGQFLTYIMDKLLLHPNSTGTSYYAIFVQLLEPIYNLYKGSNQPFLDAFTRVPPEIVPIIKAIAINSGVSPIQKTILVELFTTLSKPIAPTRSPSIHDELGNSMDNNICLICYVYDCNRIFEPCKHTSCHHCITRHLLTKKTCFFCRKEITNVNVLKTEQLEDGKDENVKQEQEEQEVKDGIELLIRKEEEKEKDVKDNVNNNNNNNNNGAEQEVEEEENDKI
ncbi:hypothetical protein DFA_02045 [Cavenderia fasciculata]|uniref:RING-type domain-containing protein n=1 Tax=Cavenderia fasciculata TaxID=261658 RepID=F4PYJ3_CACFS|nr:uncharacterized protein DFA_02045 [Cavenderia fasciculata]EGG19259.1 hypothetical protein DFA_02045 [Cavenderia fasciculata]|eukprot:XP_004357530.1 hypothetical protein DFA_02045 [Cavenderia fasciculata]